MGKVEILPEICKSCGFCITVCPKKVLEIGQKVNSKGYQYAEAKNVAVDAVWGLVMGTVTASGIPEAIAAAVLVAAIGKALLSFVQRQVQVA